MADMKHWAGISEAGSLFGMRVLLFIYKLFGRSIFRVVLLPVMAYFYVTRSQARKASKDYLMRLHMSCVASQPRPLSSFQHFLTFGEVLLDKLLVWMGQIRRQDVVFESPDAIAKLDSSQQGGVIVVSHLGNTEICSAIAHQLPDIKVTMLVYTQHAERFNSLMKKVSGHATISMMEVTDISPATAMVLADRVAAGEYIVIAGDRTPVTGGGRTSSVDFLGAKAPMPQGAFILAGLLRCPVYLMFCLKQEARYHIYLELFAERLMFERRHRAQQLDQAVQRYADRLEAYCKLAPLQWFNFFPFWYIKEHDVIGR